MDVTGESERGGKVSGTNRRGIGVGGGNQDLPCAVRMADLRGWEAK